jgi:UDP-N-acetylmuramoylalanine--D-glutamate ligase
LLTPPQSKEPWLTRRGAALMPLTALKISGRHNAANALATLALGDALRLPLAPMLEELREFTGLPHRAQWVADIQACATSTIPRAPTSARR